MNDNNKLRRGTPLGNQNARKHGFYSQALSKPDRKGLRQAASVEGVDEEIALLRLKLKSILINDPDNYRLIDQAISSLVRLLRTKNKLAFFDTGVFIQAVENVLRNIAVPLGVDLTRLL
ncbi:hypothetical protein ACFLXC_04195 [Chloroflexota bacterium]